MSYKIFYTRQARKDAVLVKRAGLEKKALSLIALLEENPYQNPPPYEKLLGDLSYAYSRRLNIQHRLVYEVDEGQKAVKLLRMWTHYE